MAWFLLMAGGCGAVLSHRFRENLDAVLGTALSSALRRVRAWLEPVPGPDEDLLLAGRLVSSLQAGISLDAALESAWTESRAPRLRALLDGRRPGDFLGGFLRTALDTGMPALASLQNLERALRARRKLSLRAAAASANARAQAEVLSWLPWALAGAVALVDPAWLRDALGCPASWLLWAGAVLLTGAGRGWIRRAVARALRPRTEEERIEEQELPDLVLRVIAGVSQGIDVETAVEQTSLARAFASGDGPRLARLRSTLRHAALTGAPVREELSSFLQDLQADLECRWEERVQRLPVALLGPLFACFFPGSLLVLAGLLLPLLRAAL